MKWGMPLLAVTLLLSATASAAEGEQARPVAFWTHAKAELDAAGHVTITSLDERLPEELRGSIARQASQWHFEPARRDGIAVAGTTYLTMKACLAPAADGNVRLALSYRSNGPRLDVQSAPAYPTEAFRAGISASLVARYRVRADGRAELQDIQHRRRLPATYRRLFDASAKQWLAQIRYLPEQVDGQPVSTQMETPLEFTIGPAAGSMAQADRLFQKEQEQRQAREAQSPECLAAGQALPEVPVALDSPIRVSVGS